MSVESEMKDMLDKKDEANKDKYLCPKCNSIISVEKGKKPEKCYQEQGGCGKKSKKYILLDENDNPVDEDADEDDEEKKTKEQVKIEKLKEVRQKEEETDKQLKEAKIENLDSTCYTEMDNYVGMVKTSSAYGAIIEGRGGTGKTWRAIKLLEDADYTYTDSFTTPQALYCWMYKNRNKDVLVVDDVFGFLDNLKVLAFLKGGLWHVGESKNRIVHYMTSKPLQDDEGNYVPNAFVLNARMIIITNKLNRKNPHLNAILTRVNCCKVEIDYDEMMNIFEQVTKKDYAGLSSEERIEVFDFIKNNTSQSNDDLNIRTLIKCFQQKVYSKRIMKPELWKQLTLLTLLQKNPALIVVEEVMKNDAFLTEEDRIAEFKKKTGRSRATYYRLKEQLAEVGDDVLKKKDN
jgi:hypothetical protein